MYLEAYRSGSGRYPRGVAPRPAPDEEAVQVVAERRLLLAQ
jgi:hypothetical protein